MVHHGTPRCAREPHASPVAARGPGLSVSISLAKPEQLAPPRCPHARHARRAEVHHGDTARLMLWLMPCVLARAPAGGEGALQSGKGESVEQRRVESCTLENGIQWGEGWKELLKTRGFSTQAWRRRSTASSAEAAAKKQVAAMSSEQLAAMKAAIAAAEAAGGA